MHELQRRVGNQQTSRWLSQPATVTGRTPGLGLVQAKRARLKDEDAKNYTRMEGHYETLKKKGDALWKDLHARLESRAADETGREDAYDARYQTKISGQVVDSIVRGTANKPYMNTFSDDLKNIVHAVNDKTKIDTGREGKPMFNSDILRNQHRHLIGKRTDRTPGVLDYIIRPDITNEPTRAVISLLHGGDEAGTPDKAFTRIWRPGQGADFFALLRTPNVGPAPQMLRDYPSLGRTIDRIETHAFGYGTHPAGELSMPGVVIHMKPYGTAAATGDTGRSELKQEVKQGDAARDTGSTSGVSSDPPRSVVKEQLSSEDKWQRVLDARKRTAASTGVVQSDEDGKAS